MEPNTIQSANAEGSQSPFMLQAAELALDSGATTVQGGEARRVARIIRNNALGLDPDGGGLALAGRAAPLGRLPLVVGSREPPQLYLAVGPPDLVFARDGMARQVGLRSA
jgi:hypothetical protein